jgi:hypothetical protein
MLASIQTQDYFKLAAFVFIILGTILATLGGDMVAPLAALFTW